MAQLVLIDTPSYIEGKNNIGDVVSIQEDDVDLSGPHYHGFQIMKVPGVKPDEIRENFKERLLKEREIATTIQEKLVKPKYVFAVNPQLLMDVSDQLTSTKLTAPEKLIALSLASRDNLVVAVQVANEKIAQEIAEAELEKELLEKELLEQEKQVEPIETPIVKTEVVDGK